MPPEALREMTIAVVSSSLSSCSTPIMLATFSNGTPAVSVSTGVVIGLADANGAVGIFITPRLLFAVSRNSCPPFLYTIMSSTRLPAPNSAIVVPRTFSPALRSAIGNLTSGVHVAGDQVLLVVDRVRDERVDRRPRLDGLVIAVINLDAHAAVDRGERIRNRPELGRKFLVRQ